MQLVLNLFIAHLHMQAELCSLLDAQKTTFLEVKYYHVSSGETIGCVWAALSKLLGNPILNSISTPNYG